MSSGYSKSGLSEWIITSKPWLLPRIQGQSGYMPFYNQQRLGKYMYSKSLFKPLFLLTGSWESVSQHVHAQCYGGSSGIPTTTMEYKLSHVLFSQFQTASLIFQILVLFRSVTACWQRKPWETLT